MQSADVTTTTEGQVRDAGAVVLGRYRLIRRLGQGAFGVVWLAHDEHLDRVVAVKRIACHDEHVAARAEREGHAAARLAHPGIVALYEATRDDEAVYLVSELVRGRTLADLTEAGALSDRDVLRIGAALCDALGHAHARGVVHRDVKPANVMVPDAPQGEAGIAKLTDFGVARIAGDDALTRTGDVVGTLAYMAPEQAEGREVTGAADVYSLGLVLYEALSGVNPVRAPGAAATARRVGARLPPLARLRRDLPREVCDAIDAAVWPHEAERGTLEELRDALDGAVDRAGRDVGPVAGDAFDDAVAGSDEPVARRPGLAGRLAAATGAAALLAAGLAAIPPGERATPGGIALAALIAAALVAVLPRAGWLAGAAALVTALAASGLGGSALIVTAAALPVPFLLPRDGRLWSAPAGAPLLGIAGAALAWPALAAQATGPLRRAALAALGLWWLLLAEPLAGGALLLGDVPGTPPRAAWEASAADALTDVLVPLVSSGALALALVWALAAALLPIVVRGRTLALDVVLVSAWAAALAAASAALAAALPWGGGVADVRGLAAGAVLAGLVALAGAAVREVR